MMPVRSLNAAGCINDLIIYKPGPADFNRQGDQSPDFIFFTALRLFAVDNPDIIYFCFLVLFDKPAHCAYYPGGIALSAFDQCLGEL